MLGVRRACAASRWPSRSTRCSPRWSRSTAPAAFSGLEAYQSGFLISAEGHVAHRLELRARHRLHHGHARRRPQFEAKLVGADPRLELAVLKIDADDLPHFDLAAAVPAEAGTRVLAFSNLFGVATGDEPASVQHGVDRGQDAARRPPRRVRDALSRPGLRARRDDQQSRRRRRSADQSATASCWACSARSCATAQNNIWLNYAIPIDELRESVEADSGRQVRPPPGRAEDASPRSRRPGDAGSGAGARRAGADAAVCRRGASAIRRPRQPGSSPTTWCVFVGENLVHSCKGFRDELARIERDADAAAGR